MKKVVLFTFIVFVSMFVAIAVSCSKGGDEEK